MFVDLVMVGIYQWCMLLCVGIASIKVIDPLLAAELLLVIGVLFACSLLFAGGSVPW